MDVEELEKRVSVCFQKLDLLRDEIRGISDQTKWQGSSLNHELGFLNNPQDKQQKGRVYERIEAIEEELHGDGRGFGVASKVAIMWKAHFPIWATITSGITALAIYFMKVFAK